jgi:PAS domain S-box-containing protein
MSKNNLIEEIEQLRKANQDLKESEERWRSVLEASDAGVWDWNLQINEVFFSLRGKAILGFEEEEIENHLDEWTKRIHPDDIRWVLEELQKHLGGETPIYVTEHRVKCKNGTYNWILSRGKVISRTSDGKPLRMVGTYTDVTERKITEESLRDSEVRFREMFNHMPSGVAVYEATDDGEDFVFKDFNLAGERISRVKREALVGKRLLTAFPTMKDFGLLDALRRVYKTGEPEHLLPAYYKDQFRDGWRENFIYKLPTGEVVAIYNDVTEGKQAEEALRKSEERYRNIFENAVEGIFQITPDGRLLSVNPALARMAGHSSPEEMIETPKDVPTEVYVTPQDYITLKELLETQDLVKGFEAQFYKKNGDKHWVSMNAQPVRDASRKILYHEGTVEDITERKRMEEALREYERAVEGSGDMIAVVDRSYRYTLANQAFLSYREMTKEQVIGHSVPEVVGTDIFQGVVRGRLDSSFQGSAVSYEMERTFPALGKRDLHVSYFPIEDAGRVSKVVAVIRDITERKQAEDTLREARDELETRVLERTADLEHTNRELMQQIEERISAEQALRQSKDFNQAVLMSIHDHIAVLDRKGRILAVNESWMRFARENGSEVMDYAGVNYMELCRRGMKPGDETDQMTGEAIRMVTGGSKSTFELEYPCDSPTGRRWFHMTVIPFKGQKGGVVVTHHDVTKLKEAEEALELSEASLRRAQDVAKIGNWSYDFDTDELSGSEAVYAVLGVSPGTAFSFQEYLHKFVHPDDRECLEQSSQAARAGIPFDVEFRINVDDGVKWVRDKLEVEYQGSRPLRAVGIVQDVTRQKSAEEEVGRLQQELAHASRLATTGELSQILAHEFNQPLTAILTNGQVLELLLKNNSPDLEEVSAVAGDIIKDGKRAREIIQRLRFLLKKEEPQYTTLNLHEVIREAVRLIKTEAVRRKVRLVLDLGDEIIPIQADRVQIQQVMLNLFLNAFEAMGEQEAGLVLTVRTRAESNAVTVVVQDTGIGLDDKTMGLLFEPFYTTKQRGLGLGLSISRSIVETHGGTMGATLNTGGGATFFFTIPIMPTQNVRDSV